MMLHFSQSDLYCTWKKGTEGISQHTFLFFSFHLEKQKKLVHKLLPVHPKDLTMGFWDSAANCLPVGKP